MTDLSHLSSAAGQLARRELSLLPRLLKSGEEVCDICHGTSPEGRAVAIVVTDRRVLQLQRRRVLGARVESVPLERVRTAEEHVGVRHATVTVDAGGRLFELRDVDLGLARVFCARVRARIANR